MKTHNTSQETPGTPLEAFDTIYMNLATIDWKNIAPPLYEIRIATSTELSGLEKIADALEQKGLLIG